MRVSLTARCVVDEATRAYAEAKLRRLERHDGRLEEVRLTLEQDTTRLPAYSAEAVVRARGTQLASSVAAGTLREAIDLIVDKVDRQVLRRKERVREHKGHAAAGSDPHAPGPRHADVQRPGTASPPR